MIHAHETRDTLFDGFVSALITTYLIINTPRSCRTKLARHPEASRAVHGGAPTSNTRSLSALYSGGHSVTRRCLDTYYRKSIIIILLLLRRRVHNIIIIIFVLCARSLYVYKLKSTGACAREK